MGGQAVSGQGPPKMSDATAFGQFLIGGLVGLVVVIVLTCVLYCCYTKRREKKRKKPPAQKRKRRPPNVISHLHGWVWLAEKICIPELSSDNCACDTTPPTFFLIFMTLHCLHC